MKLKSFIIGILVLAFVAVALAAVITITIPPNDIPRVQEAFGNYLGLGRPATQTEITNATQQWIIQTTKDYERRKDIANFSPPPLEMQPTPTPTATP